MPFPGRLVLEGTVLTRGARGRGGYGHLRGGGHLLIVFIGTVPQGEANSSVAACPSQPTQNLAQVLWNFSRLLTGKLEWLAAELSSRCDAATSKL